MCRCSRSRCRRSFMPSAPGPSRQALAPLADNGVLIVGSGSLTHNLYEFRSGQAEEEAYAAEFAARVRGAVKYGDRARLLRTLDHAPQARRAPLTAEHFWPPL